MTFPELLAALADAELEPIWTDAGLRLRGRGEWLTKDMRRAIRDHREALEQRLRPKPGVILWRLQGPKHLVVLRSPPCKEVPYGADAWAELMEGLEWNPLETLPPSWGFDWTTTQLYRRRQSSRSQGQDQNER